MLRPTSVKQQIIRRSLLATGPGAPFAHADGWRVTGGVIEDEIDGSNLRAQPLAIGCLGARLLLLTSSADSASCRCSHTFAGSCETLASHRTQRIQSTGTGRDISNSRTTPCWRPCRTMLQ